MTEYTIEDKINKLAKDMSVCYGISVSEAIDKLNRVMEIKPYINRDNSQIVNSYRNITV